MRRLINCSLLLVLFGAGSACRELPRNPTADLGLFNAIFADFQAPGLSINVSGTTLTAQPRTLSSLTPSITLVFTEAMDLNTMLMQTTDDVTCSGNIQLSFDNFSTCAGVSAQLTTLDSTTFVIPLKSSLYGSKNYKLRFTGTRDLIGNLLVIDDFAFNTPLHLADSSSFLASSDGSTVTDKNTSLVWRKAQTTDQDYDSISAATNACTALGSFRVPSIMEFATLPSYPNASPSINTSFFTATNGTFWTSTTIPWATTANYQAQTQNGLFNAGLVAAGGNGGSQFVHCVSSSTTLPAPSFTTDTTVGTVFENNTNLTWLMCGLDSSGATRFSGGTCTASAGGDQVNFTTANTACSNLDFAGKTNWRLPTTKELAYIVDYTDASGPMINAVAFPNTAAGNYWTSTQTNSAATNRGTVDFNQGPIALEANTNTRYVRCVSDNP